MFNGVFTLPDSETNKAWVVSDCLEVFILHRDQQQRRQRRFLLGSVLIYRYDICVFLGLCPCLCVR